MNGDLSEGIGFYKGIFLTEWYPFGEGFAFKRVSFPLNGTLSERDLLSKGYLSH